ncbi:MAG TPA: hypothetical protein VM680_08980, partial [Verrucomicrobiae bacterium]|nr:hypothetical protein [Verrucomicrobiae bacterium]
MKTAPRQKVMSSSQRLLPTQCRKNFPLAPRQTPRSCEPENFGANPEDERLMPENEPENCLKMHLGANSDWNFGLSAESRP